MPDAAVPPLDDLAVLRAHAETLERQLAESRAEGAVRLVRAELKAEAVRAGMVDLDGLKLIDAGKLAVDDQGEVRGATELMDQFKRDKPWLFASASSSSRASPPPAQPPKPKLATQMTDAEYRAARAELLKRRF